MMDLNVLKICSSLKWGQNWNQPGDWHILTKEAFWTYLDPSWLPLLQSSCCTRTHKSRLVMGFQQRVSLDTIPGYGQCCRGQHEVSSAEIKHVIVSWKSAICFPNVLRKRNYLKATEKKNLSFIPWDYKLHLSDSSTWAYRRYTLFPPRWITWHESEQSFYTSLIKQSSYYQLCVCLRFSLPFTLTASYTSDRFLF